MKDLTKTKNIKKGKKYSFVFARIKESLEAEFPIEAIALEECIISDRLRSFLKVIAPLNVVNKSLSACRLVEIVIEYKNYTDKSLLKKVKVWLKERNRVIHGVIINRKGEESKINNSGFIKDAKTVAENGIELVRELDLWVRKKKREINKTKRGNDIV